jgi:DNA-binding MarR family transcriptional regulator
MAARKSTQMLSQFLKPLNLPIRIFEVMLIVDGQQMNQTSIGQRLHINKNVMVKLIDEMEKRQLCRRVQNTAVRRLEYNIELTEKGIALCQQASAVARKAENEMLDNLSTIDEEFLSKLLSKFLQEELNFSESQ